ncbi:MAG TPA: DoxX family membrane protein [Candidatus Acidoferrales bacterium]|nr:DoxX family membrane protein [Candidatus Acidoferrales bacterium]
MATTNHSALSDNRAGVLGRLNAQIGLAVVRLTIGAMFVSVFFENLGKGLYTPSGYAGLIHGYIQDGSAPDVWKSVMGFVANHASIAAPLQAVTEISLGILLVLGLFARPVALLAAGYLASLWVSEWGTAWIWELLVPVLATLALAIGGAGRTWGIDSFLARKRPASLWW